LWNTGCGAICRAIASCDVLGVNGGEIWDWDWDCDRDLMDWARDDWRLCPKIPARGFFGDLLMFNGATTALECLSIESCSRVQSAMMEVAKGDSAVIGATGRVVQSLVD
jgi:hypothetical protein